MHEGCHLRRRRNLENRLHSFQDLPPFFMLFVPFAASLRSIINLSIFFRDYNRVSWHFHLTFSNTFPLFLRKHFCFPFARLLEQLKAGEWLNVNREHWIMYHKGLFTPRNTFYCCTLTKKEAVLNGGHKRVWTECDHARRVGLSCKIRAATEHNTGR